MTPEESAARSRRRFLKYLAGSPLAALVPGTLFMKEGLLGAADRDSWLGDLLGSAHGDPPYLIDSPDQAINVFDFEAKARDVMPVGHFSYVQTGSDDDETLRANREGFSHYVWHPRRLLDVSKIDTTLMLFGQTWGTPIFTCPTSSNRRFHPEGELAVARACKPLNNAQMISTAAGYSYDDVTKARGVPGWFQLYWRGPQGRGSMNIARNMIQTVEANGCQVVALTVDQLPGRNTETERRMNRVIPGYQGAPEKTEGCNACHTPDMEKPRPVETAAMKGEKGELSGSQVTWETVQRLRDVVKVKFMLKGIVTPEDAELSLKYGLDGVYVSNHGGRSAATGFGTIEALPAIAQVVGGKVPILFDSGVRRGTDVFKALALGATAVGVGRPNVWGLGSFGEAGSAKVLSILQREFDLVMRQAGVTSLAQIKQGKYVTRRA